MPIKKQTPEAIVAKLRQVDVLVSQGSPVTGVTYYRLRQEYGGLKLDQIRRLKELELGNVRLQNAVSDLTLDKLILTEAARGNSPVCVPRSIRPSRRQWLSASVMCWKRAKK